MDAASPLPVPSARLARAIGFVLQVAVFGLLPVLLLAGGLLRAADEHGAMFDLRLVLAAADDLLAGRSPYPAPELLAGEGEYLYPPVLAWLLAPLAAVPELAGQVGFFALQVACVPAALLLLGVRDWRCHGAALLGSPVLLSLHLGTAGPLLLLGVAAAWRLRTRVFTSAVVLGVTVALKPFVWPVLLWPALRRRVSSTAIAIAAAGAACLAGWAAAGFAGLLDYPTLVREAGEVWGPESYSPAALLASLDVPFALAAFAGLAAGLGLLAATRAPLLRSEPAVLALCVAAALVATPIAWEHYLVLLLVPIALASPRLSLLWLAPVGLHLLSLPAWSEGRMHLIAAYLVAAAAILAWALSGRAAADRREEERVAAPALDLAAVAPRERRA